MTIGEKIRYCRTRRKFTQGQLAELSEIHPVSIRKYETNKMQPQPAQIERIAAALQISYNALSAVESDKMRLETTGDFIGVLIVLLNSQVIQISGERGEDYLLEYDTVTIKFNPLLVGYMEMLDTSQDEEHKISLKNILINIRSYKLFKDLLVWEKMNYLYEQSVKTVNENMNEATQAVLDNIIETKEKVELELQLSTQKLCLE